jgi:hypothetical protein
MTDERRIAHGLADARCVIDPGREQHRPAVVEPASEELLKMMLVADPMAAGNPGAAGNGDNVGRSGSRCGLFSRDLIDAVSRFP